MGVKPKTGYYTGSGHTWTLPDTGATDLEFEGSRVKSPILGRDFNPFGRGDGAYYAQGAFAIFDAKPAWVGEITTGWGNSICNGDAIPTAADLGGSPSSGASASAAGECCGGGEELLPPKPPPPISELKDWCEWMLKAVNAIGEVFSGRLNLEALIRHLCSETGGSWIVDCVCDVLTRIGIRSDMAQVWADYEYCLVVHCGGSVGKPTASTCAMQCWFATIGLWIAKNVVMPCMGDWLKMLACATLASWVDQALEAGGEPSQEISSINVAYAPVSPERYYEALVDMRRAYGPLKSSLSIPCYNKMLETFAVSSTNQLTTHTIPGGRYALCT